jgi:hypothetical protein
MNACSTKMNTVREILRLSPHADERFLFDFAEQELAAYLEQLRRLERELGSQQLLQPIPCEC